MCSRIDTFCQTTVMASLAESDTDETTSFTSEIPENKENYTDVLPPTPTKSKSSRQRRLPLHLVESMIMDQPRVAKGKHNIDGNFVKLCYIFLGKVRVVCNQTGKVLQVPVKKLSKETGESLHPEDLVDGTNVLYEGIDNKTYDVTIRSGQYFIINYYC